MWLSADWSNLREARVSADDDSHSIFLRWIRDICYGWSGCTHADASRFSCNIKNNFSWGKHGWDFFGDHLSCLFFSCVCEAVKNLKMTYINFNFMLFVSSALEPSLDERGEGFIHKRVDAEHRTQLYRHSSLPLLISFVKCKHVTQFIQQLEGDTETCSLFISGAIILLSSGCSIFQKGVLFRSFFKVKWKKRLRNEN